MMRKRKFFNLSFLLFLTINGLFLSKARSEEYIVGDDDEWNSQANFLTWSQKYNFSVGDILVFKYVKGQHDVYEVEEKTFRSCDTSSGVFNKYETGNDRITLEAKKYWFLCNIEGHCLGGMRFGINVKHISLSPSSQPNQQVPITPPPTTSSCTSIFMFNQSRTIFWTFVVPFGLFFKLHLSF